MTEQEEVTGHFEVLDAIEATIRAAPKEQRDEMARVLDAYSEDFPEEFFWAVGAQAPALLHYLLSILDRACRAEPRVPRAARH